MTYTLGVDLGTTFTAAAVDDGSGPVPLKLGSVTEAMPSVVAIRDGEPVTGEAAEEVVRTTPAAGVREAKRRLGDSTPFVIAGTPYGAEALMGLLLADVIRTATRERGQGPAAVVLAHPANWGDFKKDLLSDTARVAGLDDVGLITEPQAAAIHYVRSGELQVGQTAAVYDFGGGTFDAAVVRCVQSGPELLGEAKGLERLGGIDLDQAILMHVNGSLDGALRELDPSDPTAAAAMAAVRASCVAAKETLSSVPEATVSVALPGLTTEVRITRTEFEEMLRPRIADTLGQLDAALASAGVAAAELSAVVLVGGTSRIPLVSEMVAAHAGVRVVASADHKTVVCAGTAAGDAPASTPTSDAGQDAEPASAFVVTGPPAGGDGTGAPAYRGGVTKRRLVMIGGAAVLGTGAVLAGASAAGATPADAMNLLGLGEPEDAPPDGKGSMLAADLDEFEAPPPEPEGAAPQAGGSPMARVAAMGHRGSPAAAHRPAAPDQDGPTPSARPGSDPEFMQTKSELLASIQKWQPPAGVDPKVAAEFRAELLDRIQRFQAMPGESAQHALAAMKDEYQDQVKDFVQDQRLADLVQDKAADDAAAAAVDAQLDGAKAKLLAGLGQYKPPPGTDPEDYAAMRADVEALIDRYQPVPGQTAEQALAELRYQYESRVRDMAQDMKIDHVADELTKDDTVANATTTVTEGTTTITYGPAYYDRATNPPRPNIVENPDGTRTVTFVNEQGRQVSIKTSEAPDVAIEKYQDHMPPPPESPEHSPVKLGFVEIKYDAIQRAADSLDDAPQRLGLAAFEQVQQAVITPVPDGAKAAPAPATPAPDDVVGDDDLEMANQPPPAGSADGDAPGEEPDEFAPAEGLDDHDDHDEFRLDHDADKPFDTDDDDPFAVKDDAADEFDSAGSGSADDDIDAMH